MEETEFSNTPVGSNSFLLGRLAGTQELLLAEVRANRIEIIAVLGSLEKRVSALENYRLRVATVMAAAAAVVGVLSRYLPDILSHLSFKGVP